ncbi:RNA-directed DNA polymerase, eukaryota, reverse transcriptase zinc-binding domain protein, partial [Tanacetum coccineum]
WGFCFLTKVKGFEVAYEVKGCLGLLFETSSIPCGGFCFLDLASRTSGGFCAINGSTTMEFQLERGLRQGDPLAPFLFILAMEGFHIAMEDAIEAKKYIGINIGDACLSHLIYADDVIVLGEWSQFNLN